MDYKVLLNELKNSVINDVNYKDESKKDEIIKKLRLYIKKCFGDKSEYLIELEAIRFDSWNICYESMQRRAWQDGTEALLNLINIIIEELSLVEEIKTELSSDSDKTVALNNKVFIIHGHDEALKQEVARFIEKIGLEAVILHEQSDNSEAIIEKIERCSDVGFAVALLTPDDRVFANGSNGETKPAYRARQNVIFEIGFFIGRIGRNRVFTIVKGDNIEILSDFSGIVYNKYYSDYWKLNLIKVLKSVGYDVDANDVL